MELDSQESPGEIKRREVELDSQESPGEIKRREVELDSQEDSQQLWPSSSVLVKMWFNNSVFDRLSSSVISKFVSATLSVPDNGLSSSVLLKVCLNNSVCA